MSYTEQTQSMQDLLGQVKELRKQMETDQPKKPKRPVDDQKERDRFNDRLPRRKNDERDR